MTFVATYSQMVDKLIFILPTLSKDDTSCISPVKSTPKCIDQYVIQSNKSTKNQ